jgi:hypothetical protein
MSEQLTERSTVSKIRVRIPTDARVVDAILDSFIIRNDKLRKVFIDGKTANNLKTEFEKRIKDRYLHGIICTEIKNKVLYLKK